MRRHMMKLIARSYTAKISMDGLMANVPWKNGVVLRGYPLGSKLINEATGTKSNVFKNDVWFILCIIRWKLSLDMSTMLESP